jgi:hypothetical protein
MCGNQVTVQNVEGDLITVESPEINVDSIINLIIGEIVSISVNVDLLDRTFPSTILKKIDHNDLRRNKRIIQQYKSFSSHIEKAYATVDKNIINGKQSALLMLNEMYFNALEKYQIDPFDIDMLKIREYADDIVDNVIKQLLKFVYKSANVPPYKERVQLGINIVVAHAFVECLVLENPNVTN